MGICSYYTLYLANQIRYFHMPPSLDPARWQGQFTRQLSLESQNDRCRQAFGRKPRFGRSRRKQGGCGAMFLRFRLYWSKAPGSTEKTMDKVPMTIAGHKALIAEYSRRTSEERPKIIRDIAEARAHGDLSENAEYHAAKEMQSHNEGRIQELG